MNIVDCGESQESHKNIEADTDVVKKGVKEVKAGTEQVQNLNIFLLTFI